MKLKYLSLFDLESCKRCIVADRIFALGNSWNWKASLEAHGLAPQLGLLSGDLLSTHFEQTPD